MDQAVERHRQIQAEMEAGERAAAELESLVTRRNEIVSAYNAAVERGILGSALNGLAQHTILQVAQNLPGMTYHRTVADQLDQLSVAWRSDLEFRPYRIIKAIDQRASFAKSVNKIFLGGLESALDASGTIASQRRELASVTARIDAVSAEIERHRQTIDALMTQRLPNTQEPSL